MREVPRPRQGMLPSPNLADRLVGFFSPEHEFKRLRARAAIAILGGGYASTRAGKKDRWTPPAGSADAIQLPDLAELRDQSRDLLRNPLGLGAVNGVVTSVVGTGLSLQSQIDARALGMTEDAATAWQEKAESLWRGWAESPDCDVERHDDFYGLQSLAFRSALESGDCFALLPMTRRDSSVLDLQVQLVEADRVTNPDRRSDTDTLRGGIEKNSVGAPVAYHISNRHPGDLLAGTNTWSRFPAFGARTGRRNVLHLYTKLRPGQSRGVPYLAPVIDILKQLGDYTDAEVAAAVVSSLFTAFVTTETGEGLNVHAQTTGESATANNATVKMGKGAIVDLLPGEDVKFADPNRPNTAFDAFMQSMLTFVGTALELPKEVLIKHFNASYSASRAALMEVWKFYRGRRAWLVRHFCQPVYEAFMDEAVADGLLVAPGYFRDPRIRKAYLGANWVGDSPGQLDPYKEVLAAGERMLLGISTLTEETTTLTGGDWQKNHAQQVREKNARERDGLAAPLVPPAPGLDRAKSKGLDPLQETA